MEIYLDNPLFGVSLSILVFLIARFINSRTKITILNPLLLSTIGIIGFLIYFNIDHELYDEGASIISFFIAPATVVLAVPLYKNIQLLRERWLPVLIGISLGSLAGLFTIFILSKYLEIDNVVIRSMLPKATTMAISMELSEQIGGIAALSVASTAVAGIGGNFIGEYILRMARIEDRVAKGTALGTASHAVGTARAMEMGEAEGAMASLSIGLAGMISVFLIPWFMGLMGI